MSGVREVVAAMTAYTLELREAEVKLNQNESPFDLPREIKERLLARAAERPWNIYPDFESMALREAIARAYGFGAENILVGNGSNELLAAAIFAFVGPGTPVVFPRPTFTLYEKLVTVAGGLPIPIDFSPDSGLLPLDKLLASAGPGVVVIVCSPNNPTGGVLPDAGLAQLLATGATVLFDRAYGDFAGDELPPLDDRLVTFSTFSKAWGLAALRVGWLVTTAATAREIRKVKLPYSLNVISESIAVAALDERTLRDANVRAIVDERERVAAKLRELAEVFPSRANFLAFRPAAPSKTVFEELHARGILVRDISGYSGMRNCLRVSIGTREENDRFLKVLGERASRPPAAGILPDAKSYEPRERPAPQEIR
ncbi:MAG TPA: histidinol-phosphate transaminase [Thermoanaerobaculia bacterium]|jgi:histidinol-phosphate aminotransferase